MKRILCVFTSLALGLSLSLTTGCAVDDEPGEDSIAEDERLGSNNYILTASAQTTAELGIVEWIAEVDAQGRVVRGYDDQGVELSWLRFDDWQGGGVVTSSGGGLVRVDADGELVEVVDDPLLFAAFGRDTDHLWNAAPGEQFRGCSVWAWLGCAGAVLGAIVQCGVFDFKCVSELIKSSKCLECAFKGKGGGSTPPPPPPPTGGSAPCSFDCVPTDPGDPPL